MVPSIASSKRAFMSRDFLNVRLLILSRAFLPYSKQLNIVNRAKTEKHKYGTAQQMFYFVFKTGDTEMQQIQQAVDLQHRQVRHPALQESCICILQHPQETHQQSPAALCRQSAGLAGRLVKTNTQT